MRPLSIVHTENSCGWGGQEIRILTESRGFLDRGHRVTLLAPPEAPIVAAAQRMGVPVITLAGTTCVSRQGVSLLSHLGLQELIAATQDSYVEIVTRLARDFGKLQQLRTGLRDRMMRSTLTDPHRFARNLEEAYRWIWANRSRT